MRKINLRGMGEREGDWGVYTYTSREEKKYFCSHGN